MNDKDLELIERFKNGDLEGFEMLVKKYQDRVINIAYPLCGNAYDAEYIAQEVFLKIYHWLNGFKREAKFSSWLYRITVNSTYDFLRKGRHKAASLEDIDYTEIADKKITPEDILVKELIKDALNKIHFEFRSALILKEMEGLPYEEIAQALKIPIGTVESRISRARQMLKDILLRKGILKNEL